LRCFMCLASKISQVRQMAGESERSDLSIAEKFCRCFGLLSRTTWSGPSENDSKPHLRPHPSLIAHGNRRDRCGPVGSDKSFAHRIMRRGGCEAIFCGLTLRGCYALNSCPPKWKFRLIRALMSSAHVFDLGICNVEIDR